MYHAYKGFYYPLLLVFKFKRSYIVNSGFPGGAVVKNLPDNVGAAKDTGSVPGSR